MFRQKGFYPTEKFQSSGDYVMLLWQETRDGKAPLIFKISLNNRDLTRRRIQMHPAGKSGT